jgi:hypothetical protein
MKPVTFVGQVTQIYRDLTWSGYGRLVPDGHPPDEKPVQIGVEIASALELIAVLPPEAAGNLELGAIVKIVVGTGSAAELAAFEETCARE